MKKLLPLFVLLIPFSLFAKFPDLSLQVNAGRYRLESTRLLFPVYDDFRGQQNNLKHLPWANVIEAGITNRFGKFRLGVNVSFAKERFDQTIHLYRLYYSPGGNVSGGDIYLIYTGNYSTLSFSTTGSYPVYERNRFGINICSSIQSSYLHYINFTYSNSAYSKYLHDTYQSATIGTQLLLKDEHFDFYVSPQLQYVIHESSEIKKTFGYLLYVGVSVPLKKKSATTEKSPAQP